jgi:hypothetical protein
MPPVSVTSQARNLPALGVVLPDGAVVVVVLLDDPHAARASAATSAVPRLTADVRILRVGCMVMSDPLFVGWLRAT